MADAPCGNDAAPVATAPARPRARREPAFRVVQPRAVPVPGDASRRRLEHSFYPPRGVLAYSRAEAVGVLRALCQRWLDVGRWPPERLEPWADLLPRRLRPHEITPHGRTKHAFTLRGHVERVFGHEAACRGYLPHEFLVACWRRHADGRHLADDLLWMCQILWKIEGVGGEGVPPAEPAHPRQLEEDD
jgi:hypothetical protein